MGCKHSFQRFLLVFQKEEKFAGLFIHHVIQFTDGSVIHLGSFFDDQCATVQLIDDTSDVLFVQRITGYDCNFTLFESALFLDCFYNINCEDCFSASLAAKDQDVACAGSSITVTATFVVIKDFNKLFTDTTDRYKVREQLLLLFSKSKLQSDLTCCTQIVTTLYNESGIEFTHAFGDFIF